MAKGEMSEDRLQQTRVLRSGEHWSVLLARHQMNCTNASCWNQEDRQVKLIEARRHRKAIIHGHFSKKPVYPKKRIRDLSKVMDIVLQDLGSNILPCQGSERTSDNPRTALSKVIYDCPTSITTNRYYYRPITEVENVTESIQVDSTAILAFANASIATIQEMERCLVDTYPYYSKRVYLGWTTPTLMTGGFYYRLLGRHSRHSIVHERRLTFFKKNRK